MREEFFAIAPKPPRGEFTVLITGGSQGSRTLNKRRAQSWPLFRESRHCRCASFIRPALPMYEETERRVCEIRPCRRGRAFITDMPAAFAQADLIVCRSGAGAVSELAAAGKPSILVPFPFAADQHQLKNAEAFERAGAADVARPRMERARILRQRFGTDDDRERLGAWAKAPAIWRMPGAARRAAEILGVGRLKSH